ncbi:MAG: hypothetical protein KDJ73_08170 [Notoacmeibacter sp.]|nr:hypothetical protein [Notoacmeibacter sp.]
MIKNFRTFALSALVGFGTIAGALGATTSNADATSIYIGYGYKHGYHHHYQPHYNPYYAPVHYGVCPSWKAVSKARSAGMHQAHVKFRNHKIVAVGGRVYGHWRTFYYGNRSWCPRVG